MAQMLKLLTWKRKDLNTNPQHPNNKLGEATRVCNLGTGEAETAGSLGFADYSV